MAPNRLNLGNWILLLALCWQKSERKLCGMPLMISANQQQRLNIVEGRMGKCRWQINIDRLTFNPFSSSHVHLNYLILHTFTFLFLTKDFHNHQPHALDLSPMSKNAMGKLCVSLCRSVRCPSSSCRARPQPCSCQCTASTIASTKLGL